MAVFSTGMLPGVPGMTGQFGDIDCFILNLNAIPSRVLIQIVDWRDKVLLINESFVIPANSELPVGFGFANLHIHEVRVTVNLSRNVIVNIFSTVPNSRTQILNRQLTEVLTPLTVPPATSNSRVKVVRANKGTASIIRSRNSNATIKRGKNSEATIFRGKNVPKPSKKSKRMGTN
ncbi:hypothetical protein FHS18_004470 [Paenibacillus phyllosphaerae]|uniref:Uncharacterized protein n=1 Tax=Paenibacillus phyllosphaerae TaxID=274593 RepID=A0A7W5B0U9_9BACL|nr:hypothetical protein [Paenibacillus phyllosphaerae]MBB3112369.1 hypothetical protein [Paenibacillus phyllosphaerae]